MMKSKELYEELENMMNQPSFQFEIGDLVHHKIFGIDGMIVRKLWVQDAVHTFQAYDMGARGEEMRMYCEIDERWLGKGHLNG